MHIRADRIKRPLTEGTEIELTIKIDASRKMSVELFIPLLNQTFADDVYIPDPPSARSQLQQQLDLCFERINFLRLEVYGSGRDELIPAFEQLQLRAEAIAEQVDAAQQRANRDPDALLSPTLSIRRLRMQLTQIEEQYSLDATSSKFNGELRATVRYVSGNIESHGTEMDRRDLLRLVSQYERYREREDARGLKWIYEELWSLHYAVIKDKLWHWQNQLRWLKAPASRFLNREQAEKLIGQAEEADARGDAAALRSACHALRALQPADQLESARDQEAQSGLRGS